MHLVFDTHQQHAAGEQQRHERRILQHNPQQAGRDDCRTEDELERHRHVRGNACAHVPAGRILHGQRTGRHQRERQYLQCPVVLRGQTEQQSAGYG